jgi:acyl-CoA synthetase (NDP forming)
VTVVALYLESVGNPRKFARLARRVARRKPVVLLKGGRSPSGQRAGLSHTAAAATNDVMVDALCQQAGITRVETLEELVEVAMVFDAQPLPAGGRVAIIGNAGGAGVLAADAAQRAGLEVPELSPAVQASLRASLPMAAVANPVDLGAAATPEAFAATLADVAQSGEVDAIVALFGATAVGAPDRVLSVLDEGARSSPVPLLAVLFGIDASDRSLHQSGARKLPVYGFPETAVRALAHAVRYARWQRTSRGQLLEIDPGQAARVSEMIAGYLKGSPQGGWPDAPWTCALLGCYGIGLVPTAVAGSAHAAAEVAERSGYPVVVKTALSGGVHKTDIGGVRVGIESAAEVSAAYESIKASSGCSEVIVQPMITNSTAELAMGVAVEPSFGPIVMVGLGGITTDLLDDRAFHAAPITDTEARQMVLSLRAAPLLTGYRGSQPVDVEPVLDVLQRVARLAADHPEIVELDLNPVIVRTDGAVAFDVRLRLAPTPDAPDPDLRRLRA